MAIMSRAINDILGILRDCHKTDTGEYNRLKSELQNDSLERVKQDVQGFLENIQCNMACTEFSSLKKMLAMCNLNSGDEERAISCLVDSHALFLRQQAMHRCLKMDLRESLWESPQVRGLNKEHVGFKPNDLENYSVVRSMLAELPKEWYVVQITSQYNSLQNTRYNSIKDEKMHAIHISILPTGRNAIEPFCVTLPKPKMYNDYDICQEIQTILSANKSVLLGNYHSKVLYWKTRKMQDSKMKAAIKGLENIWLREWRILLMADFIEDLPLIKDITEMIDKLLSECKISSNLLPRTRWLLKKIALGAIFLTREEIARAVKYVVPDNKKLVNNIILSIYGKLPCMKILEDAKRKNLIFIVDEHMDYLAFESMEILKRHPVTRFPSLYIAYALFKEHESTMQNGCRIIKVESLLGKFIVNPAGNLENMEKRLKLFMEYWLPHWKGIYNEQPTEEMFMDAIINHDVLMYNGHGSGMNYLSGEQIEKLRVKAVVLLFGCCSLKLFIGGGRYPPYGISNQYLIASSPSVLGMLWEVTDVDIDKMTTKFLSNWIPSTADHPWSEVDIEEWCTGKRLTIQCKKNHKEESHEEFWEPEMLRAAAKSKDVCFNFMTEAAIIMRGLPVKFV